MIKDIPFDGLSTTPDDFQAPDGHLATSLNLIHEDGHLTPLPQPNTILQLNSDENILSIHTTVSFKHYILLDNIGNLSFIDADDSQFIRNRIHYFQSSFSAQCQSIGNTLCILASDGLHYLLWKSDINNYLYLGQKPPQLDISFSLQHHNLDYYLTDTKYSRNTITTELNEQFIEYDSPNFGIKDIGTARQSLTESAWTVINRVNADIARKGDFYAPFYIRYCYRLFDGSCVMHSAPVLMARFLNNPYPIRVDNATLHYYPDSIPHYTTSVTEPTINRNFILKYEALASSLHFSCINFENFLAAIQPWRDIVKSVDFFISAPITPYISSKNIINAFNGTPFYLRIPSLENAEYIHTLQNMSPLYLISSFTIPDSSVNQDVDNATILHGAGKISAPLSADVLATQEAMPDDYLSHNTIMPSTSQSPMLNYNSRLHIAEVYEQLFEGFPIECMLQQNASSYIGNTVIDAIAVSIATSDGLHSVIHHSSYPSNTENGLPDSLILSRPLFYPDARAKELNLYFHYTLQSISETDTQEQYLGKIFKATFPMIPCPMINGATTIVDLAYADTLLANFPAQFPYTPVNAIPYLSTNISPDTGKIYSTLPNNPFFFPSLGRNTIGTGHILGIATTTHALSQGQFGQHPLYAFTSDGIWALAVSTTGYFTAVQPISRVVCNNPASITPIDNSIIFTSSQGLMQLSASNVICISTQLSLPFPNIYNLPHINSLFFPFYPAPPDNISLSSFLSDAKIIYDYTNQRLIIFNTQLSFALVYSIKSKHWGSTISTFAYSLNDYPDNLAVTTDNRLAAFHSSSFPTSLTPCLLISRPIKLTSPNALKTIQSIVVRGQFASSNLHLVLYGSRDLTHWHLIASSVNHRIHGTQGSSYKYFRVAILSNLSYTDFIDAIAIDFSSSSSILH